MNLLHLQYFYVVAREGGFSKASQVLKVNQSALSRMVKNFEDSVKMTLLERQPRGVRLTASGETVFRYAGEIFDKVQELEWETDQQGRVCQGELRVGTTDAIAKRLLPRTIKNMMAKWPQVYPIVQVGLVQQSLPQIVDGRLEIGLFFHVPELPHSLVISRRWPIRYHLVCAKAAGRDKSVLQNFIGSREVDDTFNRRFPTLDKWKKKMPQAKIGISSNSHELHIEMVKRGMGISVLPEFLVGDGLRNGSLVDLLPAENLVFDLKLVQRRNVGLSFNAGTFLEFLAAIELEKS